MIKFYDSRIIDILPENLKSSPEAMAISHALERANKKLIKYANTTSVYAEINGLPEDLLDLLAIELRSQYYNQNLNVDTKRKIVSNTLLWYFKAGTPSSVEELVNTVFGIGKIEEWFQYDGEPHCFRVNIRNMEVNHEERKNFIALLECIKRESSYLEDIYFTFQGEGKLDLKTNTNIGINTYFHPCYNIERLYLDGTWEINGMNVLNGYKLDNYIDLYPVVLKVFSYIDQKISTVQFITFKTNVVGEPVAGTKCMSRSKVEIGMGVGNIIHNLTSFNVSLDTDTRLITGKDIWCLDGSVTLDGSRIIPAELGEFNL